MAFISRNLTKTELRWGELEQIISLVSWALRKFRRYSTTATKIVVIVDSEEDVHVILDKGAHLRLRALMVDLTLYNCVWVAGGNDWKLGKSMVERPE